MIVEKTKFKGLVILRSKVHRDQRGFFKEIYKNKIFKKNLIFDCLSHSKKNTIRGLHFQRKNSQGKFITVVKGEILDIAVDLRKRSKTFGKVFKIILSRKNSLGLYIPAGFGHAYYSFENENIIYYKLENFYKPQFESGIVYNDKKLKIKWPKKKMILSNKDKRLISFEKFCILYGGL